MKLGYIDYLNCYPFYYHMFEKEALSGITLFPGYPSTLNRMMKTGDLHMSPISAATCADISDDVYVLPNVCLSSVGYVKSVILVSKKPIEDLDGKTIGITSASHTSVVLLKILLKKYFNLVPVYTDTAPMPTLEGMDAALLIGNEAMIYQPKPGYLVYDLGELWLEKTGFPVVFAVFTVRKDAMEAFHGPVKAVIESYDLSIQCLKTEKMNLIAKAAIKYPDISYSIEAYFNLLQFNFTERLKHALAFYHGQAGDMGLVKPVTKLSYLDMKK
ncbi:MAG: menaquinone biosynthesis protein [Proteobacteria bacterium]|nr:menaquinone biosynthesis protein [Pseudomonadota bacterium]